MHLIYTLTAMLLVGLLALSQFRTAANSQQRMVANEVLTQVTGVSDEVFEHAVGYWFDERVDEDDWPLQPPTFPIITESQVDELTATSTTPGATTDGWGGCTAAIYTLDANMKQNRLTNTSRPETCDDLDDLHGLTLQMEREKMLYEVDFAVRYVDPTDLTQTVSGPTFAKALTLTITTPNYVVGNDPLEITMSQVFTYSRLTTTVP